MSGPRLAPPSFVFLALLAAPSPAAPQSFPGLSDAARAALRDPGAPADVGVWLDDAPVGFDPRARLREHLAGAGDAAAIAEASARQVAELSAAMRARVTGPFAAAARGAGLEVALEGALVPIVYLRGNAAAVDAFLASRADARFADVDRPAAPELNASVRATHADRLAALPIPLTGAGTKACDIEFGAISGANPYLPAGILQQTPGGASGHATGIAGMIASSHGTYRGMAPGAGLLSANASSGESGVIFGAEWAFTNGADVCNVSVYTDATSSGPITLGDRAFDYLIRNLGRMIVKSAGNQGSGGIVTSPGRGWSCIAVGNFDDKGTAKWTDDAMSPGSSTKDPASGAPKPELTAPGTNITSTLTGSPWIGNVGDGTSYSAPHVVGGSCLLFEKLPALRTEPELLRAIWVASAWHNVEGATALSEADGAGAIDAFAAHSVIAAGRYAYGTLVPGDFAATGFKDYPVHLVAGNRARVAVSWDSNASAGPVFLPDVLQCKLDVQLLPPGGGAPIATASHPAAAWRILEATPPTTGIYTVRLVKVAFDGASEPYGVAVSQIFDGHASALLNVADQSVGTTRTFHGLDPYHGSMQCAALASLSGGAYETGPPLFALPRTIPLVIDDVTLLSVSPNPFFLGFVSTLTSTGRADFTVTLPPEPLLIGFTLTYAFVTLDPTAPDGVRAISPPAASTIVP